MQISDQIGILRDKYINYANSQHIERNPMSLYEPINYIMNIGGKRLRPVVLLAVYNMYQSDLSKALPLAYGVELFHNFSLVHDDIMDEADMRRKQPTVHQKYGQNTAILAGDMMLIDVYNYLLQIEGNPKEAITVFNRVSRLVCEGQQMDMDFEERDDVPLDEYIQMISGKTAALLGGSVELGALIGGATTEACAQWYSFGFNLGIAFQMRDDILDTFGDEASFGKRIGGDILEDKNSILMVLARLTADEQMKQALDKAAFLIDQNKIDVVTDLYKELGVQKKAEVLEQKYYDLALQNLTQIEIPEEAKKPILDLAKALMSRSV